MKNKKRIAVVIAVIAVILLIGLIFWLYNTVETEKIKSNIYEDNTTIETVDAEPILTPVLTFEFDKTPVVSSVPSPAGTPASSSQPDEEHSINNSFASITICTDRKTRTYEVMPNVDEKTLRKNIGWLPGSAMPGQEGLCILMGHRDTDFSILKYAEIGDVFTVKMDGVEYSYMVSSIEIVESDNELQFKGPNGKNLALVTCYPFRYSGHAPKKIVITCKLQ